MGFKPAAIFVALLCALSKSQALPSSQASSGNPGRRLQQGVPGVVGVPGVMGGGVPGVTGSPTPVPTSTPGATQMPNPVPPTTTTTAPSTPTPTTTTAPTPPLSAPSPQPAPTNPPVSEAEAAELQQVTPLPSANQTAEEFQAAQTDTRLADATADGFTITTGLPVLANGSAAIAPLPANAIVPAVGLAFDPASLVSLVQIQKAEEENPADIPEDVEFVDSADLGLAPSPGPYPELLDPQRSPTPGPSGVPPSGMFSTSAATLGGPSPGRGQPFPLILGPAPAQAPALTAPADISQFGRWLTQYSPPGPKSQDCEKRSRYSVIPTELRQCSFLIKPRLPTLPDAATARRLGFSNPDRYSGITYQPLPKEHYTLFSTRSDGPSVEDILQNQLGDCWLLSALESCLLDGGPRSIKIRQLDSTFTRFEVEFKVRTRPVIVRLDNQVPFKNGEPWPAEAPTDDGGSGLKIAWPLLWTKAYLVLADHFGSFTTDKNPGWLRLVGDTPALPILAITGRTASGRYIVYPTYSQMRSSGFFSSAYSSWAAAMRRELSKSQATVFTTMPVDRITRDGGYNAETRTLVVAGYELQILRDDNIFVSVRRLKTNKTVVLVMNHCYSAYGRVVAGDQFRVFLTNPWGYNYVLKNNKLEVDNRRYINSLSLAEASMLGDGLIYG